MVDYQNIPYMFTYATSSISAYNSPALIFACLHEPLWEEFIDKKTALKMSEHPLIKDIMGNNYLVSLVQNIDKNIPKWVFHLNLRAVLTLMDKGEHEKILLKIGDNPLGTLSTKQILDQCYLPHKYTQSCVECATSSCTPEQAASEHNCIFKQLVQHSPSGYRKHAVITRNGISLENLAKEFKLEHRKTKINDFVYISPTMTGIHQVPAKVREVSDHFFSEIQKSADCRSEAQQERKRYSDFQKEVCPTCGVYKTCENNLGDRSRRFCKGPYPKDQKEMVQTIIQNARNPFTIPQLCYLLANSGTLPKRYNHFLVSATLSMYQKQLVFAIRRNTKPDFRNDLIVTSDFQEARALIQKYGNDLTGKYIKPLTQERLAILYEAASRDYSPTHRGYWRTTSYPVLFIESNGDRFVVNYSYQGRGVCGFDMTLNSIQDIYLNFERFTFLLQNYHSLRKNY
jgi:hypothetical protein